MASVSEPGQLYAQKIIEIRDDGSMSLNVKCLEQILLKNEIANKRVCVISIVGTYRQGKSFFLNFLIRHLRTKCENSTPHDNGPITGFTFKGGCKTVTNGIMIWPEIFLIKLPSDEEVAVVLMDTQGLFDNKQKEGSEAFIFALSTLVSSVQIYNLKNNINSLDLEILRYFLEYAKLFGTSETEAVFQNFLFLIRDWRSLKDYPYGEWGNLYMDEVLHADKKTNLRNLFKNIGCFLLPHPGLKVDSDDFSGDLEDITEDFKIYIENLISTLLSPDILIPKVINGQDITVKHLVDLFKQYCQLFNSKEMPKVESMFAATETVQHLAASKEAEDLYDNLMKSVENLDLLDEMGLREAHERCKHAAIQHFIGKKIIGGSIKKEKTLEALHNKLEEKHERLASTKREARLQQDLENKKSEISDLVEKQAMTEEELNKEKSEKSRLEEDLREARERANNSGGDGPLMRFIEGAFMLAAAIVTEANKNKP